MFCSGPQPKVAEPQNSVVGIPDVALRRVAINYLFTRPNKDGDSDWIRQGNYELGSLVSRSCDCAGS